MHIEKYSSDNFQTINSWAKSRNKEIIPLFLSENGFLVKDENEPILVVFVYFLLGVPVVQLDYFLSKPGISFWKLKKAWKTLFPFIKDYLNEIYKIGGPKYHLINCNIDSRLGKHLKNTDNLWIVTGENTKALSYII